MTFLQSILLGIVEGITEFLPISSTGHLILVGKALLIPQTEFVKSFEIIIQLGAILAVAVLYGKFILERKKLWPIILVAFIPTAILGFVLYSFVKRILLGNAYVTVIALFLGGIFFLIIERLWTQKEYPIKTTEEITYKKAFGIGIIQSISMIPGVSRSAASIIGGMFLGLNRETAVEFSFLLAIPTMAAATALDLFKTQLAFTSSELFSLVLGFITAFITALLAVKFFLKFIKHHTFVSFGIYRILLAIFYWYFLLR